MCIIRERLNNLNTTSSVNCLTCCHGASHPIFVTCSCSIPAPGLSGLCPDSGKTDHSAGTDTNSSHSRGWPLYRMRKNRWRWTAPENTTACVFVLSLQGVYRITAKPARVVVFCCRNPGTLTQTQEVQKLSVVIGGQKLA